MTLGTYQVGDLVRLYDLSATLGPWVYKVADFRFSAGKQEALIIDAEGPEAVAALQWVDTIRLEKVKEGNTNGTRTQPTSAATDLGGGPGLRDSGRDLPGSGPAGGAVNAPVIPPDELARMVATVRHWQKGGGGSRGVAQVPDTDEGFAEAVAKLINFRLEWILRDAKREHELDVAKVREEVARMTAKIQGRVEELDRRLSDTQRDLSPLGIRMDLGRLLTRVEMLEEGKTPRANPLRPGGDPATDSQLKVREEVARMTAKIQERVEGLDRRLSDTQRDLSPLRELDARIRNLSGRFEQLVRDAERVDLLEDAVKGANPLRPGGDPATDSQLLALVEDFVARHGDVPKVGPVNAA